MYEAQNVAFHTKTGGGVCTTVLLYCAMEGSCFHSTCGFWILWLFLPQQVGIRKLTVTCEQAVWYRAWCVVLFDCRAFVNFSHLFKLWKNVWWMHERAHIFLFALGSNMTRDGAGIEQSIHLLKGTLSRATSYRMVEGRTGNGRHLQC